jgi:multisubunit Na+/H+ antiporter MnhF subunit
MADLNPWLIAATVLILGLIPCGVVIARKSAADGLAALQLAGILTTLATLLLAAGFHRPTVADISMALALLTYPSSLLFAHFLERWL